MTEARIECLCHEYVVADLHLHLRRGDVVWLSEAKARGSAELSHAESVGAVTVRWMARCAVSKSYSPPKSPAPPWVKRSRPGRVVPSPVVTSPPQPAPLPQPAPAEPSEHMVATVAARVRSEVDADFLGALRKVLREEVGEAVQQAVAAAGVAVTHAGAGRPSVAPRAPDEPVFIPSGIVPDAAMASVSVPAETTSAATVDDAAAALKAARKPRTKKES